MKTSFFVGVCIMLTQGLIAQKIEPYLIGSTGGYNLTGPIRMHWAVGEVAVGTHQNGLILTEGLYQAWATTVPVSDVGWEIDLNIYPNPAQESLTVTFESDSEHRMNASVFNLLGKKVMDIQNLRQYNTINISALPPGQYLLHLTNSIGNYSMHKFIKL